MIGRQPVRNFTIETIYDSADPRLTEFRKSLFIEDLNLPSSLMAGTENHSWWINTLDVKIAEDAFKYSDNKWFNTKFDNIESIIDGDKIVGISGCRQYNSYLRTSMHLYLLKSVRAKYPGIKYIKGGWFERHLSYATQVNCTGAFFTVYAYSRKLRALIRNHGTKTISLVDREFLHYIDQIEEKGEYLFNGVPQTFFYYPITTPLNEFNPYEFI